MLRNVRLIEELRASRQRLVAAQDEERRRLERNIHDGVQQQLVALSVQLRLAEQLCRRTRREARGCSSRCRRRRHETLEDLRDLARGIYPPLLADKGLAAALEAQARKAAVPTTVDADGSAATRDVEAAVYFCALEALEQRGEVRGRVTRRRSTLAQRDGRATFAVTRRRPRVRPATPRTAPACRGWPTAWTRSAGPSEIRASPGPGRP